MNHVIRKLTVHDVDELEQILIEVHDAADRHLSGPIGSRWSRQQLLGHFAEKTGIASLDEAGRIRAFILFRPAVDAWEIELLATALQQQRQGRMGELIGYLLEILPKDTAVWLEVHEANDAARQRYQKSGFQIVGQRPRYYADGGAAILYNYG